MAAGRLSGLDRLRGAALMMMLVHHLTEWYGGSARSVMPGWAGFSVTDVAAPAFTVALGASVPLMIRSRRRRGSTWLALAGTTLRRYGLLIPIGIGLRAAMGFDLGRFGVLETLGLCALVVAVFAASTRGSTRVGIAVLVMTAAPFVERAAEDRSDWIATNLLTGTFPLMTYIGFALLGAAVVPALLVAPQRGMAAGLAAVFTAWTAALTAMGDPPDRYPGDVSFIVPGIAGTLLLYLAVSSPRVASSAFVGRMIERAGAHTFGVFLSHYAVYLALKTAGQLRALDALPAAGAAVVTTMLFVLAAPRIPPPRWSPRTGWRQHQPPPPARAPLMSPRG